MNRIILIGNGFDLAHGLKTSYKDFINDFWINEIRKSYDMKYLKTEVSDGKAYYIF
ncbi:MAG: bacteriophage abortive infection AbiH family protein, partial [Dysgonamonadaceae bacterium]|nr:bacteriophage abortive infection AbiH family protein [Dysgonamonadaceae bacterium]